MIWLKTFPSSSLLYSPNIHAILIHQASKNMGICMTTDVKRTNRQSRVNCARKTLNTFRICSQIPQHILGEVDVKKNTCVSLRTESDTVKTSWPDRSTIAWTRVCLELMGESLPSPTRQCRRQYASRSLPPKKLSKRHVCFWPFFSKICPPFQRASHANDHFLSVFIEFQACQRSEGLCVLCVLCVLGVYFP